eukprot:TRINITY_DN13172_c0_g1_i1.p1 TRINITY_DN13172_c0_g1~~TRINITY_DN13172_c0_g1_i1.p1  ORF type:complete len:542 (-),score=174.94 TRINITY_DN13172_c0_g1_i1:106-1512(-)
MEGRRDHLFALEYEGKLKAMMEKIKAELEKENHHLSDPSSNENEEDSKVSPLPSSRDTLQFTHECHVSTPELKHNLKGKLTMTLSSAALKLEILLLETGEQFSSSLKISESLSFQDLHLIFQNNTTSHQLFLTKQSSCIRLIGFGLRESLEGSLKRYDSEPKIPVKLHTSSRPTPLTKQKKQRNKASMPDIHPSSTLPPKQAQSTPHILSISQNNNPTKAKSQSSSPKSTIKNRNNESAEDISLMDFIKSYQPKTLPPFLSPCPEYSLCLCSISTSAYAYDIGRASAIGTEVIGKWLQVHRDPRVKIYLVDICESETLRKFRERKMERFPELDRFEIRQANLVQLKDSGIPCWFVVNASNPNFKSGGSGTNKAIYRACKGENTNLEKLTHKLFKPPAVVAKAYPVDLPPGIPLREEQEVRTVIHVVGPNMSPKRPNYLKGDYEKGDALLRRAYEEILEKFLQRLNLES